MDPYVRHLVTQKLGRTIGTVELNKDGEGRVQLSVGNPPTPAYTFQFHVHDIVAFQHLSCDLREIAVRFAVKQAHKLKRSHPKQSAMQRRLQLDKNPWVGDFATDAQDAYPLAASRKSGRDGVR